MPRKLIATAEAPVKVIISGEHGIVHGTPGIAMSLTPKNKVQLYETTGERGLELSSDRGKIFIKHTGEIIGSEAEKKTFEPFAGLVKHFVEKHGFAPKTKLVAEIHSAKAPKGVGNSASIAAALSSVLFHAVGKEPKQGNIPEEDELWMAVQSAEEIAHGARPSGIDAMTVSRGSTQLERIVEAGKVKWNFTPKHGLTLPTGSELIIVDTYKGGERGNTGQLIKILAGKYGLVKQDGTVKTLSEITAKDKATLQPFVNAFKKITSHLKTSGDIKTLGEGFNDNHAVLKKGGVSTPDIEKVVELVKKNGAHGAKLTGAGGNGGAVIVLAEKRKSDVIKKAIQQAGFGIFPAQATTEGTKLVQKESLSFVHKR